MSSRYRINGATPQVSTTMPTTMGQQSFRKGQIVFNSRREEIQSYMVASGEIVIVRNGSMVDIVEPGEYLDPSMWNHAVGVAWTDCRLVGMD